MNKSELIKALVEESGLSFVHAKAVVEELFRSMVESLRRSERIEIRGFGSFRTKEYGGYVSQDPRNGSSVEVGLRRTVSFKPGVSLRLGVNGQCVEEDSGEEIF